MKLKERLLPAGLISGTAVLCILLCRQTRLLFFVAVAIVSGFELHKVLSDRPVSRILLGVYIAAHGAMCWFRLPVAWMIALFFTAAFATFFWSILRPGDGFARVTTGLFLLVWPFGFYAVTLHAAASDAWLPVLAIAILSQWACDSMALIGGSLWGKRPIAPQVSPHKTWAGTLCGAAAAALAGVLICLILRPHYPVPMLTSVLVSLIASSFGQAGDLAASLIKRAAGVKDYGHLAPEHGGVMDKTDSILFAIPTAYLALMIAGVI